MGEVNYSPVYTLLCSAIIIYSGLISILLCAIIYVGIGNSSECDYVRVFVHYATSQGFRVVVQNHVGALKNVDITGNRIFTYGIDSHVRIM